MSKNEEMLQKAIVKYWDYKDPKFSKNLFHVNNNAGGRETIQKAAKLKSLGVRSGVSDLILIWDKVYFIELKTPIGKQSGEQKSFQSAVVNKLHNYLIIRSLDEFIRFEAKIND